MAAIEPAGHPELRGRVRSRACRRLGRAPALRVRLGRRIDEPLEASLPDDEHELRRPGRRHGEHRRIRPACRDRARATDRRRPRVPGWGAGVTDASSDSSCSPASLGSAPASCTAPTGGQIDSLATVPLVANRPTTFRVTGTGNYVGAQGWHFEIWGSPVLRRPMQRVRDHERQLTGQLRRPIASGREFDHDPSASSLSPFVECVTACPRPAWMRSERYRASSATPENRPEPQV
jgi:hypothetical protein